MNSSDLVFTPLRISTLVTTGHLGTVLFLDKLFDQFHNNAIPIGYPGEGFLKIEYREKAIGYSSRDILSKRKVSKNSFFNQSTLVVRKRREDSKEYKEVNIKFFANGGFQMTGVTSEKYSRDVLSWVIELFKCFETPVCEKPLQVERFSVQLLNSDYKMNALVRRDELHKILVNKYKLFSTLETTIYQGINTKFFYNTNNPGVGICRCANFCKGQGTGEGDGQCKRITISIFRTGRIIITGARQLQQIRAAYDFLNGVLDKHHRAVLYEPNML
jgi:TATA-box binding protein (TBP) (component of TFIID and TFIIIB)